MKAKILIVDDEESIRFFAADSLVRAGWQVYEADSGEAALEMMAEMPCEVVFLDLRMGGIDGMETMRRIKARWPETGIIIMTAYATLDSAIEAVRQGALDYLRKPCSVSELLSSASRALNRQMESNQNSFAAPLAQTAATAGSPDSPEPAVTVRTGDLLIDFNARRVLLDGQAVSLTPTEYELLELLARSIGQPVFLEQLVADGLNYSPSDTQAKETLRVHISRLRQKIGDGYVLTVRGGYVLAYLNPEA